MKKLSIWLVALFTVLFTFHSCQDIEELDRCPEVSIDITNVPGSVVYRFVAEIDGIEDIDLTWSINGDPVDTGSLNDVAGQIFDYRFEPGTYTVCVAVADENCPIEVCKEITVERDETNPCPDLFFESRQYERPNQYKFIADFEGINEVSYGWFINGEFLEDSAPDEDNYFIYNFDTPGRYEVCIATETPDCPEGAEYCKVIEVTEVAEDCPEISFVKEQEPGTVGVYVFEAQVEQTDQVVELAWYVDGQLVESTGSEDNSVLTYQFENGTHEVCLKAFTDTCTEGVIYCKEFRVGAACPELSFEAEQDGDNAAYYFYPRAFDGIDDTVLSWFVNGNYVGDSPENPHNNPFYYQFDGPGRYEVCLKIETPDCPEGTSYCKVIEIAATCPDISFEPEQDGDNPAYYFYPLAFEGIENTTIHWFINGESVANTTGSDDIFYYQFNPGRYEVCMMIETPNCPEGVRFCKVIEIEENNGACPDLFFEIEQEGDTPGYNFFANFTNIETTSYYWSINGDIVHREIVDSGEKDDYMYYQFGAGTYEICITAETPDCPQGTTFCKTLVVE
ncbi:hypothetical protein [Aquimarina brevivitae]|uniref:PKD domain-containing protein n=1 Tax=Aquimarina brevivitae TaxID=323412 RepID=A0A4Q7P1Q4_9FLAO|nr:hypothetical protein [Aquimarina brevivitae]RZS93258.1 hypothetical protein EV197_1834 [Aquimarina brevivitae]